MNQKKNIYHQDIFAICLIVVFGFLSPFISFAQTNTANHNRIKKLIEEYPHRRHLLSPNFIEQASIKQMERVMSEQKFDINSKNTKGLSFLHYAIQLKRPDAVQLAIKHGAKVNQQDFQGNTALHIAARYGDYEINNLILQKTRNINFENQRKETPLYLVLRYSQSPDALLPLFLENGAHVKMSHEQSKNIYHVITETHTLNEPRQVRIFNILQEYRIDTGINDVDQLRVSPLHLAVTNGRKQLAKAFIKAGASVNTQNLIGETPLHWAVFNARDYDEEMLRLILGVKNIQLDLQTYKERKTALHYAVRMLSSKDKMTAVRLMYEAGANFLPDRNGIFPSDLESSYDIKKSLVKLHKKITRIDPLPGKVGGKKSPKKAPRHGNSKLCRDSFKKIKSS